MNKCIAGAAIAACSVAAHAAELPNIGSLAQEEFRGLSKDLGAAFSYKGVAPAAPLGTLGIDVGVELTRTTLEHESSFARAGTGASDLYVPKLHVHKGLPGGWDIGAFVGGASQVSAGLFGADLRYAFLDDGIARPAVALRVSGTKATGLGNLNVGTAAIDLMASKKFAVLTPYLGAGFVRTWTSVHNSGLTDERLGQGRYFGGLAFTLLTMNLAVEGERAGANTSLSAKLGFRF